MSAWGRQLWNLKAPAASDLASLHGFGLDLRRWFGPRRAAAAPFQSLEDSKHAYYLVFDFEIEVTAKFGST